MSPKTSILAVLATHGESLLSPMSGLDEKVMEIIADEIITKLELERLKHRKATENLEHDLLMSALTGLDYQHADCERKLFIAELNRRMQAREGGPE